MSFLIVPLPAPVDYFAGYEADQKQLGILSAQVMQVTSSLDALRSRADPAAAAERGTEAAASLCQRLEDFRTLGMVHCMVDLLLELSRLNKFFQFRLITYANIVKQVDNTYKRLDYFFQPEGEERPAVRTTKHEQTFFCSWSRSDTPSQDMFTVVCTYSG